MVLNRYSRNLGTFTEEELEIINRKNICIIGCGGLGGYVANGFARFGVNKITLVDGDVFQEHNLNRQLFSTVENININKAKATEEILRKINPTVKIVSIEEMIQEDNYKKILKNQDLVIDCLDNSRSRIFLGKVCSEENIQLIHGAISGWYGQVANIFPNNEMMGKIYPIGLKNEKEKSEENGMVVFIAQMISSIQISEGLKFLLNKKGLKNNEIMHIDMLHNEILIMEIK